MWQKWQCKPDCVFQIFTIYSFFIHSFITWHLLSFVNPGLSKDFFFVLMGKNVGYDWMVLPPKTGFFLWFFHLAASKWDVIGNQGAGRIAGDLGLGRWLTEKSACSSRLRNWVQLSEPMFKNPNVVVNIYNSRAGNMETDRFWGLPRDSA